MAALKGGHFLYGVIGKFMLYYYKKSGKSIITNCFAHCYYSQR